MARTALSPAPTLRVNGRTYATDTRISLAGPYIVTVSTSVPDLPAELHSTYIGHADADTQVSELRLGQGQPRQTCVRTYPHDALPVTEQRRHCLYDHLQRLQELIGQAGDATVSIDLLEDTLRPLEPA